MKLVELQRKLIAAARAEQPSDRVPFAFEKRIMALILAQAQPALDRWALWARSLWLAAAPCVVLMLLLSAWALFQSNQQSQSPDLSQQFDTAILAAMDQDSDFSW